MYPSVLGIMIQVITLLDLYSWLHICSVFFFFFNYIDVSIPDIYAFLESFDLSFILSSFSELHKHHPCPADDASKAKYLDVSRRLEEGIYQMANTKVFSKYLFDRYFRQLATLIYLGMPKQDRLKLINIWCLMSSL